MDDTFGHRVLVVDDEKSVRETTALLLNASGYDVSIAERGFDALLQIKTLEPDVIISDLNTPRMSGAEFVSVLRQFHAISVIAVSAGYGSGDCVPGGVIADVFYAKGRNRPDELLRTIGELIASKEVQKVIDHRQSAPVWIPRNGNDSNGVRFIVLTCPQCLLSFPLSVLREDVQEIQETPCLFCTNPFRYLIGFLSRRSFCERTDCKTPGN